MHNICTETLDFENFTFKHKYVYQRIMITIFIKNGIITKIPNYLDFSI